MGEAPEVDAPVQADARSTGLAHVVSLYEFDHELRVRLSDILSIIEMSFTFFIGHRLGKVDAFAHRNSWALGAMRQEHAGTPPEPTTAYREWLEECGTGRAHAQSSIPRRRG